MIIGGRARGQVRICGSIDERRARGQVRIRGIIDNQSIRGHTGIGSMITVLVVHENPGACP